MKLLLTSCLLLSTLVSALAQQTELFVPLNIQQAYLNGTRSYDGMPGPNYFQNRARYQIQVQLDPLSRLVRGEARITYFNNSPKSLRRLVLRLYQDLYKRGSERDQYIAPAAEHDGVHISRLIAGKDTFPPNSPRLERDGTNMSVPLSSNLAPGDSMVLEVAWEFIIPKGTNIRMGTYGSNSFFVAYWYPQLAVYDDIDGWDEINYGGLHEFYNDFADFDVSITVPADMVVWATGELQNAEEVLDERVLEKYRLAHTADSIVHLMTQADYEQGRRATRPGDLHRWHFRASNVPDFAFGTANYYLWDATSAKVGPGERRVYVDACYKPHSPDFPDVADVARLALEDLSHHIPGIPYPYPKMTIFNGEDAGGGMEYPMMVNDASSFGRVFSIYLTYHEVAHSYFPFYMGINERKYAWMDEGWASILPMELIERLVPGSNPLSIILFRYLPFAGHEMERPLITPSIQLSGQAYSVAAYSKPALAYHFLRDMLGDEVFKQSLQEYMRRWNGKHPIPYDFFFSMNAASGQNLNWYWNDWFFLQGYPDLALSEVKVKGKSVQLRITRPGRLPLPVHLSFELEDGTEAIRTYTAAVWANGRQAVDLKFRFNQRIKSIRLGTPQIPDLREQDNRYRP